MLPPDCLIRPTEAKDSNKVLNLVYRGVNPLPLLIFLGIIWFVAWIYLAVFYLLFPAIDEVAIQTFGIAQILLYVLAILVWLGCGIFFYRMIISISQMWRDGWVAVQDNKIIGFVKLSTSTKKSYLTHLFVKSNYRNIGIGTSLLKTAIEEVSSTVYADSFPYLIGFYTRLGFSSVPVNFLRSAVRQIDGSVRLKLDCQRIKTQQSEYIVRPLEKKDIKSMRILLGDMPGDSFLSFGFNSIIDLGWTNLCLLLTLGIMAIVMLITSIVAPQLLNCLSNYLIILFFLVIPITDLIIKQKKSQLWIMGYGDSAIGYGRIAHYDNYSVLHRVNILTQFRNKNLYPQLIQHLVKQTNKPIYLACKSRSAQLYRQQGFIDIDWQKLPKNLRLGGRINAKFNGINLIFSNPKSFENK